MRCGQWCVLFLLSLLATRTSCSHVAGLSTDQINDFNYPSFTTSLPGSNSLIRNGSLIMSQAGSQQTGSTAWHSSMVQVRGFQTVFTYTISNNSQHPNQRPDGLAFVIQRSAAGSLASGTAGAGLGYGATNGSPSGIEASVAVEFDSWYNAELNDPQPFHISVHSNGVAANNASELYAKGAPFVNGNYNLDVQRVTITYDPSKNGGTMSVQFNDQTELLVPALDLAALCALDPIDGNAYVGFTAGSHAQANASAETIAVTNWKFDFLGVISAGNSIVAGVQPPVYAGQGLSFIVQAVDQYNYSMIIDGAAASAYVLSASLVSADESTQNATAVYSGQGKYVIQVNATVSGNATLFVYLNGSIPVGQQASYALDVSPAAPFAPLSYAFQFDGNDSVAGVADGFLVQLRDAFGNNITSDLGGDPTVVSAIITSQDADSSYELTVAGTYDPNTRCYAVTYNVTVAGNFTIRVQVSGMDTASPLHPLRVAPASVNAATSVLYGASPTTTAGQMHTAYLQLKDVFGNNASTAADVDIEVQLSQHPVVVNGSVVACTQGLCVIQYNLTVASYNSASYNLIVSVDALPVTNSFTTTVQVVPAALDPEVSYAYGQGITAGVAGEICFFSVQLTDVFGNNDTVTQPTIATLLNTTTTPQIVSSSGGTYTYQYNVTVATLYQLTILVNGLPISNGVSLVTIAPNAVHPPSCVAFGEALAGDAQLVVGTMQSFFIQLRDRFLNNITTMDGGEVVSVVLTTEAQQVNASVAFDAVAGLYQVDFNITLSAAYNLSITVDGEAVTNSAGEAFNVTVWPAAIDPATSIAVTVPSTVTAGEGYQFFVQLRDAFGNDVVQLQPPEAEGIVSASFVATDGGGVVPVAITYASAGLYSLTSNATAATDYTLTILVNNSQILNSTYQVAVVPAAAYPPFCSVQGSAISSEVAGTVGSFAIYLYDEFNNSITSPADDDTPSVSIGQEDFAMQFNESIAGYQVTYNITAAGGYSVRVVVNSSPITDSLLVVQPAPLYVPNCLANGTYLYGSNAGDPQAVFHLYQRDVFGNTIQDYSQVSSVSVVMDLNGQQTNLQPIPNGDGTYTVEYNMTVAGYYATTISINQANILGSPFNTSISPDQFDPHGTITLNLATTLVAGEQTSFSIQLRDIWGNDVTGAGIPSSVTPDSVVVSFNSTPIATSTQAQEEGVFLVSYSWSKADTYFMSVTINGSEVGPSPPGIVVVQPAEVYPPQCTAEGDATKQAIVKRANSFVVVVRDRFGNQRMWAPSAPLITLNANGVDTVHGSAATDPNGTYVASYYIDEKATYTMAVYINGEPIQNSPFSINANYGNNSPSTLVIVLSVLGGVLVVAALVAGFIFYRRRHFQYTVLE